MGQIRVGDEVFDEIGRVCRVVAKSRVDYGEQAYRIRFKYGEVIEAGENHQWAGQTTHGKPREALMTTGEIYRTAHDGHCWQFRIPIAGALDLPEADLPVEPYLMGYWLGNETATKPYLTIQTCDVPSVLERVWPWNTLSTRYGNTGDSICIRIPELDHEDVRFDYKVGVLLFCTVGWRFGLSGAGKAYRTVRVGFMLFFRWCSEAYWVLFLPVFVRIRKMVRRY